MLITHTLENECWKIGVLPQTGGSIAYCQFYHAKSGQWLDFMRPTPSDALDNPSLCSSFVLVPYSNRIRAGKFTFEGEPIQLRLNGKDGTAIHGVGRNVPWQIVEASRDYLLLRLNSVDHENINWPFRFIAEQHFQLDGPNFATKVWIKNKHNRAMPAGFGQHPYFQKMVGGAHVSLQIPFDRYLPLENGLPVAPKTVALSPDIDFRTLRPLGDKIMDHCLTAREIEGQVHFAYPGVADVTLHSDPIFQHLIFYAPIGKDFYAVEPVTNLNDGFNLLAQGMDGTGVFVLDPDEEKSGVLRFELRQ